MATRGERINQGEILSAVDLLHGDPRSQRPSLAAMIEEVAALAIGPCVPKAARDQLMIAKAVFLSGYLFYELYSTALLHAAIAGETALKERFVQDLPVPVTVARRGGTAQTFQSRPSAEALFDLFWQKWRVSSYVNFDGSLQALISWAKDRSLFTADDEVRVDALREWRNITAHGGPVEIIPQGMALGILRRIVDLVNALFP